MSGKTQTIILLLVAEPEIDLQMGLMKRRRADMFNRACENTVGKTEKNVYVYKKLNPVRFIISFCCLCI